MRLRDHRPRDTRSGASRAGILLARAALALLALVMASAAPTAAQSDGRIEAPTYAVCGSDLTVQGTAFRSGERVMVFVARTQPSSDRQVEVARTTSDGTGAFRATVPGAMLAAECSDGASFRIWVARSEQGAPGAVLAEARVTFGSPSPAASGLGASREEAGTNPLLYVLAIVIGITLLRSKSWDGPDHRWDE